MARTISTIEGEGGKGKWDKEKEKKADKLIEAEKSETGKVWLCVIANEFHLLVVCYKLLFNPFFT